MLELTRNNFAMLRELYSNLNHKALLKSASAQQRAERHRPEGCATATAQLQALQQLASTSSHHKLCQKPAALRQLHSHHNFVTSQLSRHSDLSE